jgi:hypothetical protein
MTAMRRALLVVLAASPFGCLDFDVFRTEPTTGSTTSTGSATSGGGGQGGDGGNGGAGGSTTTNTGGMGGAGGGALQPCGGFVDDFDGGAALDWDVQSGSFANDRAVTMPPNSTFTLADSKAVPLSNCFAQIELAVDSNGLPFFGWGSLDNPARFRKFITNSTGQVFVQLSPDSGPATDLPVTNAQPFDSGFVRISEVDGSYNVETGPAADGPWLPRVTLPVASAPAWLAQAGRPYFGVEGNGSPAEFDNFNTP